MRSARRALGAVALALTFVVDASGVSVAAEPAAVSGEAPAVVAAFGRGGEFRQIGGGA
ncbi:hypothetical protein [Amycolatopsis sp. EV170708-02-1]|uniref:hypothetical protein n=1 Tax=Amycolatopsis sp. EV170708-02-1 TaxID=2919322 RepID=UPI001F0BC137|nr:hypothetical protein [Amycolatopsis sp. EV170708-02-1]UMP07137.1 hypothetical protein MJQ72_20990 [Amycolatopsis sp. EV170708-02-1]